MLARTNVTKKELSDPGEAEIFLIANEKMQCEESDCKAREAYLITRDNTLQPSDLNKMTKCSTLQASDLNKMTKCNILIMPLYLTIILRGRAGYLSNRPQVSMVYRLINHLGCW